MADSNLIEFVSNGPDETMEIGARIAQTLKGGEVMCFVGQLGSGKTHLIKGIAAGLGAHEAGAVNSPTFVLVNEYEGEDMRLDVYHIDAYRLDTAEEFETLGFDDMCYNRSVVLVEWADKIMSVLEGTEYILVELEHVSEQQRKIRIENLSAEIG